MDTRQKGVSVVTCKDDDQGQGRIRREGGGGGSGTQKVWVPKMTRQDFPNGKVRFFLRWSLWSGGPGGGTPLLYGHPNTSLGGGGVGMSPWWFPGGGGGQEEQSRTNDRYFETSRATHSFKVC